MRGKKRKDRVRKEERQDKRRKRDRSHLRKERDEPKRRWERRMKRSESMMSAKKIFQSSNINKNIWNLKPIFNTSVFLASSGLCRKRCETSHSAFASLA